MIPALSFIIAAYVIFRCLEAMIQTGRGGRNQSLNPGAQTCLALSAIACIIITIYYAAQIGNAGKAYPGMLP